MLSVRLRMKGEKGFTLIELLVVIIIIAILAAIAIPTFLGQREKAHDTATKTMVRNSMMAAESYYVEGRDFSTATAASLVLIEPTITWTNGAVGAYDTAKPNQVFFTVPSSETYTVGATSKSGKVFSVAVNKGAGGGITYTPAQW